MNATIRNIAAAAAMACLVPAVAADVLNFDDLPTGTLAFTGPYHGFTFTYNPGPRDPSTASAGSWYHSDNNADARGPFYKSPNTSISTDFSYDINGLPVIGYGESLAILSAVPIVFNGAYFQSLDNGIDVTFNLYLNNVLVHTSPTLIMNIADPALALATGYNGLVDKITVTGYHGFFAMDEFSYNQTGVPEPATYALLLVGAAALCASTLRRRRTDA